MRAQRDRFNQQKMMNQVIQQRRMSEFQAKQAQQIGQEMAHASPANSTTSLPNNPNMPPPPAGNIVHTPQTAPTSLPNQPPRVSASPSFSPQQVQRQGPDQPQQPGDQPMMGPPMPGNGQQIPGQPPMNRPHNMQMVQNGLIVAAMNALGLGGRDPSTLTVEEKVCI
jgi:hypothetical protein